MTVKLVMIRCPDNVAPQRREVRGGEFSIGRSQGNEWVIADPERHLSKNHCRLEYGDGEWQLRDLSTNGTFLNEASEPVGRGAAQKLRNGDRIRFGLYELEVTIEEDEASLDADGSREGPGRLGADMAMRDPLPVRPDHPFDDARLSESRLSEGGSMANGPGSPILPADFDPLAPHQEPFSGPVQSDHVPALESAFRPPRPVSIIPDDWDVELPGASRPRQATAPTPQPPRPPEQSVPSPPTPVQQPSGPATSDTGLVDAFLRGVGRSDKVLADPEQTLERVGAALRATVSGLRQTLMARASIKDEFRIEQTMIRASGNNPLKFSLDDDDALATLLGPGRRGGMTPEEAIAEAFKDLRLHELATVSAMQAAVRVLLAQFEPEAIERKIATNALHIHPAQKKAKAWEAFVHQHKSITQALSDDFDSAFGKAFARAYEEAIEKLTAEGPSS